MSHLLNSNPLPTKKSKASRACDICRKKKVKCDGTLPACSHCATFGFDCTFSYKPKKRGPSPSQQKLLESRLEKLENLVLPLVEKELLKSKVSRTPGKSRPLSEIEEDPEEREENALTKVTENFDKLALTGRKSFRYLGSSSGLYVLEGGKYNQNGLIPDLIYHLNNNSSIPQALSEGFPPEELKARLLTIYFDRFHKFVPIFNEIELQERIITGKPVSRALMNSIYALACLHVPMNAYFDSSATHINVTNYFFTRARAYLDEEYQMPSLETVQALTLMSFHPEAGWIFLGMAIRIGQQLGLHRNIDLDGLSVVRKQNRQLTWWAGFFFDRLVSAIVGRPMAIDEDDCDVKLPVDCSYRKSDRSSKQDQFAKSIRYFNQVIRLFTILTQILRTIYGAKKQSKLKARDTLLNINKSLSDWKATLLPEFWYDVALRQLNSHHAAMLALYYHYTVILANRPYIAPSGDSKSLFNDLALQACAKSASIISYILYHTPATYLLHGIQLKSTFIFSASTIHALNTVASDPELSHASKANLIVNLNLLKKLNVHSKVLIRTLLYVQDMIQSQGLSTVGSDLQEPIIYSPSSQQFATADYLANLPSRHDSESLVLPQLKTSDSNDPYIKSKCCPLTTPSSSLSGAHHADETKLDIPVELATFAWENNEESASFDPQQWNAFITMFNQSQSPGTNGILSKPSQATNSTFTQRQETHVNHLNLS